MNESRTKTIDGLRMLVPQFVSGKRLAHTYAVEGECIALAKRFLSYPELFSEDDEFHLRVAALLHDITKEKSVEEQYALCKKYHIPVTDYELAAPKVLHAKTAAAVAECELRGKFGADVISDAVCDAIRTHTTGAEQMSLIGKLLFLADYIEPTRTFEDCVKLRTLFYQDIDGQTDSADALSAHLHSILLISFDMTIRDLLENHAMIDPHTTAARNALLYSENR